LGSFPEPGPLFSTRYWLRSVKNNIYKFPALGALKGATGFASFGLVFLSRSFIFMNIVASFVQKTFPQEAHREGKQFLVNFSWQRKTTRVQAASAEAF
jgi:hypothetical protein